MASKIISRDLKDWSQVDKTDSFFVGIDVSRDENFGIHSFSGNLWTSGYIGVGRLYGINGKPLTTCGKEHVVVINSKYGMDPWKMLEKVMTDEEYEDYISELEKDKKYLFKVFYDQPVIRLNQDHQCNADILYALSFINSCYLLCKKGVKKKMIHHEENFKAKVRGRIDVQKNIRSNTVRGRNDRFYCKYIDFTADTIENRILKATLIRCKRTIEKKFEMSSEIMSRLHYCMNMLREVRTVNIKGKDFNGVVSTGLYIYYKPLIKQAKSILSQKYMSYKADDGLVVNKSVFTVPYMINMESVFEFYVRIVLREFLNRYPQYCIEKYSAHLYTESKIKRDEDTLRGIHLMPYCIPDVIICDKTTKKPVVVLDAKYKRDDESSRNDSHQLLSYVLLTGVKKCGFVFPGTVTSLKTMRGNNKLDLESPLLSPLNYYELILGNMIDDKEIEKIFI